MAEVDRTLAVMGAKAGYGSTLVAFEKVKNSGSASVTTGGVNVAFFAADDEVVDVAGRKGQGSDGHRATLLVLKLQGLLGLRQHVQAPRTQSSVGGDGDLKIKIGRNSD